MKNTYKKPFVQYYESDLGNEIIGDLRKYNSTRTIQEEIKTPHIMNA